MAYRRITTQEQLSREVDELQSRLAAVEQTLARLVNALDHTPGSLPPGLAGPAQLPPPVPQQQQQQQQPREAWQQPFHSSAQLADVSASVPGPPLDNTETLNTALERAQPTNAAAAAAAEALQPLGAAGVAAEAEAAAAAAAAAAVQLRQTEDARDAEVRAGTAALVAALPSQRRAALDALREFAYGGGSSGGGGSGGSSAERCLPSEDLEALAAVVMCGDTDGMLLSFLRPSKYDLEKAKDLMRAAARWRRDNAANAMFARRPPPHKLARHRRHWPTSFHGLDREGRPVLYDRIGSADVGAMLRDPGGLTLDEVVLIYCLNMEVRRRLILPEMSRAHGRPVTQFVTVLDLKGIGARHLSVAARAYIRGRIGARHLSGDARAYMAAVGAIFDVNYRDMVARLYIVNAPWAFAAAWRAAQAVLSAHTLEKAVLSAHTPEKIQVLSNLEDVIAPEHIPRELGGLSPAAIGPDNPMWLEIDAAMARLAGETSGFNDDTTAQEEPIVAATQASATDAGSVDRAPAAAAAAAASAAAAAAATSAERSAPQSRQHAGPPPPHAAAAAKRHHAQRRGGSSSSAHARRRGQQQQRDAAAARGAAPQEPVQLLLSMGRHAAEVATGAVAALVAVVAALLRQALQLAERTARRALHALLEATGENGAHALSDGVEEEGEGGYSSTGDDSEA
ncbi:hypothetical protein JKP88DRAFT_337025 [Tribonema minus]|uniref:CRAL-TRIO domain-containing protein n=1 Tax=Tribonema minus TaxID=303371 RepID=A0A836C941_9STRA|nr:hypothetical protein JKP88DRAFT_337025 [Tribonema minus]